MLTGTDLNQISKVVDKAINNAIDTRVPILINTAIDTRVPKIVSKEIDSILPDILEKHLKPIKKDIQKIKKDLHLFIDYFDTKYIDHDKRINRLENKIGINSSQLA